ncbi:hypothetical protein BURCENBC7_AP1019 [Burkholderia cenocepacia BC7]|nr:hypothetical protein BURCENBC7_AP1019 [Burkholderia cenocepacia BC7]
MQRGDREQPVGDVRDQEMQLEQRRCGIRKHPHAAEHERQQRRAARERQHQQAQTVEREEEALDPVDAGAEPEHRRQREREAEHHRVVRKDRHVEQHAVRDQRGEQQRAAGPAHPGRGGRRNRHGRHARDERRRALAVRAPACDGEAAVQECGEGIQYNIHVRSLH